MDTNTKTQDNFWIGKKAKIEILKDNTRLIFTVEILGLDNVQITFLDRDGIVYSFNRDLVQQMKVINRGCNGR